MYRFMRLNVRLNCEKKQVYIKIVFSPEAPLAKKHKKTAGDAPLCGFLLPRLNEVLRIILLINADTEVRIIRA